MPPKSRGGAIRKPGKGPTKGSGGQGRRKLEGKGPTPRAEDRVYHKAHKEAQAKKARQTAQAKRKKREAGADVVAGRNSVLEALREGVPATALFVGQRIDADDRVKESIALAAERGISMLEASKPDLDRLTDDAIHQGIALQVPSYDYAHPDDLLALAADRFETPLLVALDGITDPRNLGAIIRSASAFDADGVIVPERRSVGVTATAWRTSAGAAARVPVAQAGNLNSTLVDLHRMGYFVLGLDGGGDVSLPGLALSSEPLVLVVGAEGKGLSRMVREHCQQIVSIPIQSEMESLNASMAVGISLYEIAVGRAGGR